MITLDELVEMQRSHHNRITELEYRLAKLERTLGQLMDGIAAVRVYLENDLTP